MALTGKQTKHLRGLAHSLQVVVTVGRGATETGLSTGVVSETDRALTDHELIKVKLPAGEKETRKRLLERLSSATDSSVVQLIGRIGVLYRAAKEPDIRLPG